MSYIEIEKKEDGIVLKLTDEGREELNALRFGVDGWVKGTNDILLDMLEDHLCNGWEMVPPEDIGALTSAPILSEEVVRDDYGTLVSVGKVYWFPNYQIECELETMLETGEVFFPAAQEETEKV